MKVIKENIENFEGAGETTTVIDPATAEAIDQDEKSGEAMKKASEDLEAEIDGAPKAEKPKKPELPKANLDESLFEDYRTLTEGARDEEVSYDTFSDKGFYVGDICYALYDEDYSGIWGDKYHYEDGEIDINGYTVCVHGTMWGDGGYPGSDGNTYGVDAGVIGIVPLEVVDMNSSSIRCGRIVEGAGEATLEYDNGTFTINLPKETITIPTGDDEDDDWDYDEWEDYDDYDDDIDESLKEDVEDTKMKAQELADLLGYGFKEI